MDKNFEEDNEIRDEYQDECVSGLVKKSLYFVGAILLGSTIATAIDKKSVKPEDIFEIKEEIYHQELEAKNYKKEINASFDKIIYEQNKDSSLVKFLNRRYSWDKKEDYVLNVKRNYVLERENLEGKTGWWDKY